MQNNSENSTQKIKREKRKEYILNNRFDVIVIGGGIAGITASIAASRKGMKVLMIEKDDIPGGVITNSLVMPLMTYHSQRRQVTGGIAQEIIDLMKIEGISPGHVVDPIGFVETITPLVPDRLHVFFDNLLQKEGIKSLYGARITEVKVKNKSVKSLTCVCDECTYEFESDIFIDATGDGSFSILCGSEFAEGDGNRESVQPMTLIIRVGNVDKKEVIKNIMENRDNFVLKQTDSLQELLENYIAVSGFFKEAKKMKEYGISFNRDRVLLFQVPFKEDEILINTSRYPGFGNDADVIAENTEKAEDDIQKLLDFLRNEIPGFKAAKLIEKAKKIGIRETTHVKGKYTYTLKDIVEARKFEDTVSVGAFPVDFHSPDSGTLKSIGLDYPGEYFIPYSCMLIENVDNVILAGRAISCEHMAFSAIRTAPLASSTGEVAGVAAAISSIKNITPDSVDIKFLREELKKNGVIVE